MIVDIVQLLVLMIIIALVVIIVKKPWKTVGKDNIGTFFISFFFPIIGLIIYAVNIGKNDNLAKTGSKGAIYGIVIAGIVIIVSIIIGLILSSM